MTSHNRSSQGKLEEHLESGLTTMVEYHEIKKCFLLFAITRISLFTSN